MGRGRFRVGKEWRQLAVLPETQEARRLDHAEKVLVLAGRLHGVVHRRGIAEAEPTLAKVAKHRLDLFEGNPILLASQQNVGFGAGSSPTRGKKPGGW